MIYRVKVKSPDYLRLMRALAECTYDNLVALLAENPHLTSWPEVEAYLKAQGRDVVPEEVLAFYRPHYDRFAVYLADCDRLRKWAEREVAKLEAQLGGQAERDTAAFRKAFAALAIRYPYAGLLFAALDGRLNPKRIRKLIRDPEQAKNAVLEVEQSSGD